MLQKSIVVVCYCLWLDVYMTEEQKHADSGDTVVISFRAPRELIRELDEIAKGDQRTRANFIVRTLTHAVSLEPAIVAIEQIVPRLVRSEERRVGHASRCRL